MPKAKHTGQTDSGHTRDIKVERIGKVTIYKRGLAHYLYFRENGKSVRKPVEGSLAAARATAHKVAGSIQEGRPSPIGFERISPEELVKAFIEYTRDVQGLALRSRDRYRAALEHFRDFAVEKNIKGIDLVTQATIEDFVKWLRQQTRARNGMANGKQGSFKLGGIQFILSTCRTAFNWAAKRRHLPPYTDNPFTSFPIDKLKDRSETTAAGQIFSAEEQKLFFESCTPWQYSMFMTLATYGLRVGELTHLLIDDVDFEAGAVMIRSKPELFWLVKTGRERVLPIFPQIKPLFEKAIRGRKAGFVFLNEDFASGETKMPVVFPTHRAFQQHVQNLASKTRESASAAPDERALMRVVRDFCRTIGQIPERRVRAEFMKLSKKINRPDLTRAHDLRHLFASRAQELGLNPILVQELLGHTTLEMTRRYTHLGLDAKRDALQKASSNLLGLPKE